MKNRHKVFAGILFSIFSMGSAWGAYQDGLETGWVTIQEIFQGETTPYIAFTSTISGTCGGGVSTGSGNGLYLFNLEPSPTTTFTDSQKAKLSVALTALSAGKNVKLRWRYDSSVPAGWARCYVTGLTIQQ